MTRLNRLRTRLRLAGRVGAQARRRGFTIAELLIVVALLLIATGIVFPPVLRLMADQPLKEAAEQARSQIANVRLKSLDSSVEWQFRFEPGGRRYLWMPLERVPDASASTNAAVTTSTASALSSSSQNSGPQTGELPKGISFSGDLDGTLLTVEQLPAELFSGLSNAYELTQVGWSSPIAFRLDGSANDTELSVVDSRDRQIRLTIRGLTGGITVSPLETRRRR